MIIPSMIEPAGAPVGMSTLDSISAAMDRLEALHAEAAREVALHGHIRAYIEGTIERFIGLLDTADAPFEDLEEGGDLEPSFGASEGGHLTRWGHGPMPGEDECEPDRDDEEDDPLEEDDHGGGDVQDEPHDMHDEGDLEPSLGSRDAVVNQGGWAFSHGPWGYDLELEAH
ncbi:hypothetical protein [Terrihabitans sp. B22-R8]|uniref:hypothetical protein n=1 Tax=Terrihabitans sp. B22-R8 TaxID=3425128 RepID=UPI00403C890B